MNETMEKVLEENQVEAQTESVDVVLSDTVSGGDGSVLDAGYPIQELGDSTVSGGDTVLPSSLENQGMVQTLVLQDSDAAQALTDTLASLDFKVSCILFLLLFIWCEKKIRAAVLKMTGRREQL